MFVILCLYFCSLLVRWKPWLTVLLHSTWRGGRCLLICIPRCTTCFSTLTVFTTVGFEQHEYDVTQHNFFIFLMLVFHWLLGSLGLFSSVQFSHSVLSNSLRPHELQHARPPCPSPTPGVHSNSRPSSQWCHPAIPSSVVPFSSCPQSFPASESFPMSQLFAWGGQSTGVSALASFLPKNTQDWSPLERTGWISLQSKGLSRVFSNTTVQKHQFFGTQPSSQFNSHIHTWPQEKP